MTEEQILAEMEKIKEAQAHWQSAQDGSYAVSYTHLTLPTIYSV